MLPQGMFSVAVATVLFPQLSRLVARQDLDGLRRTQGNGIRQIALLLIPAAAITIALARADHPPRLRARRVRRRVDRSQIAEALFWFSFSLPFSGFNLLLTRTFFSLQRPWTPTALAGVTLLDQRRRVGRAVRARSGSPASCSAPSSSTAAMTVGQAYYLRRRDRRPASSRTTARRRRPRSSPPPPSSAASPTAPGTALDQALGRSLARADRLGRRRDRARLGRLRRRRPRHARPRGAADPRSVRPPAPPHLAKLHHCGRPGAHPQLLDHRPHRPRQVDAGRSHPRAHPHRRPAGDARPAARQHGPRARARHHDQGPGRARLLHGARRRALPVPPDRHARPRRLHVRGVEKPRRVRGSAARRRRAARASRPRPSPTPTWRSTPGSS